MNQQHQIIGLKTEKLWWNDGKLSRNKAHTHTQIHSLAHSLAVKYTHAHWHTHTHTHHVKMYCKYKIWSWRRLTISMCIAYWCVLGVVWNYFPFIFFPFHSSSFRNIVHWFLSLSTKYIFWFLWFVLFSYISWADEERKNIMCIFV